MARYYCDYCHSYLTHDTLSVRKSHLVGKNHIRLTADYYFNKSLQLQKTKSKCRRRKRTQSNRQVIPNTIHCDTNRIKKLNHKICKEQMDFSILNTLYHNSPGYNKVFVMENRLDIGEMIKLSKLPQRANTKNPLNKHDIQNDRYKLFQSNYFANFKLPPPKVLTQWNNQSITMLYHDQSINEIVVNEVSNKISRS